MIKVCKDFDLIPEGLLSEAALGKMAAALETRDRHEFSSRIYRHPTVIDALRLLYHQKCAYCEASNEASTALQVEHYRPKKKVQGVADNVGYYWLGYSWSNLLLACPRCNRAKSNAFPVKGKRVIQPPKNRASWATTAKIMKEELPLLLNPEVDEPAKFLTFNSAGEYLAIKNNARGDATIAICALNRDPLRIDRKSLGDRHLNVLRMQVTVLLDQIKRRPDMGDEDFWERVDLAFGPTFQQLQEGTRPTQAYSAYATFLGKNFETCLVLETWDAGAKLIVTKAWRRYNRLMANSPA